MVKVKKALIFIFLIILTLSIVILVRFLESEKKIEPRKKAEMVGERTMIFDKPDWHAEFVYKWEYPKLYWSFKNLRVKSGNKIVQRRFLHIGQTREEVRLDGWLNNEHLDWKEGDVIPSGEIEVPRDRGCWYQIDVQLSMNTISGQQADETQGDEKGDADTIANCSSTPPTNTPSPTESEPSVTPTGTPIPSPTLEPVTPTITSKPSPSAIITQIPPTSVPEPSVTLVKVGCYQSCDADGNCSNGQLCRDVDRGNKKCVNPFCMTATDCVCTGEDTCYKSCDADSNCTNGLVCRDVSNGNKKCVNSGCSTVTNCICSNPTSTPVPQTYNQTTTYNEPQLTPTSILMPESGGLRQTALYIIGGLAVVAVGLFLPF